MGKRTRDSQDFPAAGLRWHVVFNEGENHLRVVAEKDGVTLTDEITQYYETRKWGEEEEIELVNQKQINGNVEFELVVKDENGVICLDSRKFIEYEYTGEGELIAAMGLVKASRKVQFSNGRAWGTLVPGKGVLFVRVKGGPQKFYSVSERGEIKPLELLKK
jgi:beta-galactosidase